MLKILVFLFIFILTPYLSKSQNIFSSCNGNTIPVEGTFRILNIFVNIIYDQTPERDPFYNVKTKVWMPGNPDIINDSPPYYLKYFLDTDTLNADFPKGIMTRLFYESSFGQLVVLGDFIIVNIKQSEITPNIIGGNFSIHNLISSVINKINKLGGVYTINAYNNIEDYDFFEKGSCGLPKNKFANTIIDFLQINIRNTVTGADNNGISYNYGQYKPGQGSTWAGNACNNCKLLFGNEYYENELTSVQCIGDKDLSKDIKNIIFHEFAHNLFGDNAFHTSGGNHYATYSTNVFVGLESGYGLMGGYNSSLVSCNGYERLRMRWKSPVYNPKKLSIAANNQYSDISNDNGNKKYILRDFVTTGDAIRIKIPNIPDEYAQQYLWLENHQIGNNNTLDFFQYSNTNNCRPVGTSGIYAYIQVGRDVLESENFNLVYPSYYTDNLRLITAEGNYDWYDISDMDSVFCVAQTKTARGATKGKANVFNGYNDKQTHFYIADNKTNKIDNVKFGSYLWVKRQNKINKSELPFLGDVSDAFAGESVLNINTNPAPVNVITWFVKQGGGTIIKDNKVKPLKSIYLSGLSINMKNLEDGNYEVDIVWDNYSLRKSTEWAGNIIISEKLILDKKVKLILFQGKTPTQLIRDEISGLFAPPSVLIVQNGSEFILKSKSKLVLKNKSKLIIKQGGNIIFEKGAKIKLRRGSEIINEN